MKQPKLILQDSKENWSNLLPLTYTKPISHLRIGIDLLYDKWKHFFQRELEIETEDYLMPKFQNKQPENEIRIVINSAIIPNKNLVDEILNLSGQQSLEKDGIFIAQKIVNIDLPTESREYHSDIKIIEYPWDIFLHNEEILAVDFQRITKGRKSRKISETNSVVQPANIFLEEGAEVEHCILNASTGPIYIGKGAKLLEGCMIRGSLSLGAHSVVKMGAKIYGATTFGEYCKAGGEINNVIVQSYSNKGHDGYLGNAVIGEWCNLGADTNASNLKNNYGEVKVWSYLHEKQIQSGRQFIGLIMGDHAKSGINTMFNTATVVGVAANVFGGGFTKNHIPSFSWGGVDFIRTFLLPKAFEMAETMMIRRKISFTQVDKDIFTHIFENTKKYRN